MTEKVDNTNKESIEMLFGKEISISTYSKIKLDTKVGIIGVIVYFIMISFLSDFIIVDIIKEYGYVLYLPIFIIPFTLKVDISKPKSILWMFDTVLYFVYFTIVNIIHTYTNDILPVFGGTNFVIVTTLIVLFVVSVFSFLNNHTKNIHKKRLLNDPQSDVFYRGLPSAGQ